MVTEVVVTTGGVETQKIGRWTWVGVDDPGEDPQIATGQTRSDDVALAESSVAKKQGCAIRLFFRGAAFVGRDFGGVERVWRERVFPATAKS